MLSAVGWTVLRLRLDAKKGDHIGDRDVVVESSGFTRAAQSALVEAIEDFKEQRPGRVRIVPKGKSPRAAQRRSHIANIGPDRYPDDTYWFTWYPGLDSPESHRLRVAVGGRYLYCPAGRGSLFVDEVGLHEVARDDWKARLTAYLADKTAADLRGTTKWPWGHNLLIPHDPVDLLVAEIVAASDHEKQNIDRIDFWFNVSGDHIAKWSSEALFRGDETLIVHVHPAALEAGYRIVGVTLDHGYRGHYQRIAVSRVTGEG